MERRGNTKSEWDCETFKKHARQRLYQKKMRKAAPLPPEGKSGKRQEKISYDTDPIRKKGEHKQKGVARGSAVSNPHSKERTSGRGGRTR